MRAARAAALRAAYMRRAATRSRRPAPLPRSPAALQARMPPEQRVAFAAQNGMPAEVLAQIEAVAEEQLGMELVGGRSSAGGEGEGGEEDGAPQAFNLVDVAGAAYAKMLSYGATFAFYGALPAMLALIALRHGMSASELWAGMTKMPFE
jgi:hypothetical protein